MSDRERGPCASNGETSPNDTDEAARVAARLRDHHAESIARVWDAADAVAEAWDGDATPDREAVVAPLERRLRADGTLAALLELFPTATDELGTSLAADPVPAPPYLVVTATGPILRATLPDRDGRLVVELRAFRVVRGGDDTDTAGGSGDTPSDADATGGTDDPPTDGPSYRRVDDDGGRIVVSLR
ncbi:hypothetical protein RYH80_06550 [Halobaculum sp. MBLA0147]|uniref:hypothetical protein n=1 Tax=Halobaculum sp. MBLA0147 TaxID=3079934 RepID=UPI0035256F5F